MLKFKKGKIFDSIDDLIEFVELDSDGEFQVLGIFGYSMDVINTSRSDGDEVEILISRNNGKYKIEEDITLN